MGMRRGGAGGGGTVAVVLLEQLPKQGRQAALLVTVAAVRVWRQEGWVWGLGSLGNVALPSCHPVNPPPPRSFS